MKGFKEFEDLTPDGQARVDQNVASTRTFLEGLIADTRAHRAEHDCPVDICLGVKGLTFLEGLEHGQLVMVAAMAARRLAEGSF